MKASVIIPVWNGEPVIDACLQALAAQQDERLIEVICVDNASPDNSAALIAQRHPTVRLLREPINLGFAGGCNRGIAAAQGDVIILLNQDAFVQPGWLAALLQALAAPQVGVVGCKILYPDGKTIQHAGGWMEWPLALGHHHGDGELDQGQWDQTREVEWVTGAALAIHRPVLDQVGGLDEGFFPGYFEDADLCLRVNAAGYAIVYAAEALVWHLESSSQPNRLATAQAYQRGRLRFLLKQMPPARWLAEFVPAEKRYQPGAVRGLESASLSLAYLTALSTAPRLLVDCWQADTETIHQVLQALQQLYQNAWQAEIDKINEGHARLLHSWPGAVEANWLAGQPVVPHLTDFAFPTQTPLLGPLIRSVRKLWYTVAARWGVQHLRQQQDLINQQHAQQLQVLQSQVQVLTWQCGVLTRQLVELQQKDAAWNAKSQQT